MTGSPRARSIRKVIRDMAMPKRPLPAWQVKQPTNRKERRAAEAIKRKANSNAATRTQT